jgi:hypothetical protein
MPFGFLEVPSLTFPGQRRLEDLNDKAGLAPGVDCWRGRPSQSKSIAKTWRSPGEKNFYCCKEETGSDRQK